MKIIPNYSHNTKNITFGDNHGFFTAIDGLKKFVNPEDHYQLNVHASDLKKDNVFWKKVNKILDDDNVKPVIKKMINMALGRS